MCRRMILVGIGLMALLVWPAFGADVQSNAGWRQDRFLITFWCPPPATDEALVRVAAEHYNLTWVPEEGLDVAARHGLRAMLTNSLLRPEILDDADKRTGLDALIARVKDHPALEAYYIVDEPSAGAFAALGRLVAYLRQRDPKHLAYINLFPTYANEQQLGITTSQARRDGYPVHLAGIGSDNGVVLRYREHLMRFVETVKPDLISYDHYHFFLDGDGPEYFLNLALIREAALACGKPFLNIIQASTVVKAWRFPTAAEVRWLAFTTMAYGGRGISYFTYWGPESYGGLYRDGKPSPLAADVAALNAEIEKFGPALMTLDSLGAYHTDPLPLGTEPVPGDSPVRICSEGSYVLGLFGQGGSATAFMLVNRDYRQSAKATLQFVRGGGRLKELDRTTGEWIEAGNTDHEGKVTIALGPGDGRLFRMP